MSFLYTHTVLVVVIGSYTFESRIHKGTGVQLYALFLLQISLTDGTVNTTFS